MDVKRISIVTLLNTTFEEIASARELGGLLGRQPCLYNHLDKTAEQPLETNIAYRPRSRCSTRMACFLGVRSRCHVQRSPALYFALRTREARA